LPALRDRQETIRVRLPTKTYYPTIIAGRVASGLFAKEGIKAELTIYRGGRRPGPWRRRHIPTCGSTRRLIAAGRRKAWTKAVAGAALGYYGWYLMVKTDSKIARLPS
jgi:NitT/TauT family transport system substrate-binding protein